MAGSVPPVPPPELTVPVETVVVLVCVVVLVAPPEPLELLLQPAHRAVAVVSPITTETSFLFMYDT
jgi:hypothetical protein